MKMNDKDFKKNQFERESRKNENPSLFPKGIDEIWTQIIKKFKAHCKKIYEEIKFCIHIFQKQCECHEGWGRY